MKIKEIILKIRQFIKKEPKLVSDLKNIALMLLFCFLFLFFFANRAKFYPENIILYLEGKFKSVSFEYSFPAEIEGQTAIVDENIKTLGGDPVVLSGTSFNVFNGFGKLLRTEKHNLATPRFKTGGIRAILYDVGGKNFQVQSVAKTLFKSRSNENILSCDIAESGNYATLTESHGYLSEVKIYNHENTEKYKYCFSECHASDVSVHPTDNKCLVSGISFANGKINSLIYALDFKSEKPENVFSLDENTVMHVHYFQNGNILAIGDKYAAVINQKTKHIQKFDFSNLGYFKFYSFTKEYGAVFCFSESFGKKNDDKLILLDNFGKTGNPIQTNASLKKIAHCKNRIAGLSNEKILIYSLDGYFEGSVRTSQNFSSIAFGSDSLVYATANTTLDRVKIHNLEK